jgi:diguanylate cyclase (GGDEF)-like protein
MKKFLKIVSTYSLEEKISLVLLISGLTMSAFGFVTNVLFNMPFSQNWPNLLNVVYLLIVLVFFNQRIFEVSRITILLIGFFYFPYLFDMSNGHIGAGPIYFLMIIVYIAFFLRGKSLVFVLLILLSFYSSLIIMSFNNPDLVVPYPDEMTRLIDITIAFVTVGIVVSIIGYLVFTEYNKEKEIIEELMTELKQQNVELELTSITDPLTKVFNRRYFMDALEKRINKSISFFVLMLDIDHFKNVNDEHGHIYGDEVLVLVADTIKQNTRSNDIVARYGGEEFSIIIQKEADTSGVEIAERIRKGIEQREMKYDGVTISIGVVEHNDETSLEILKKADDCLYLAKEQGRNKVISQ